MEAYSRDLRVRVLADCDAGMRVEEVAEKFSVSPEWVRKIKRIRARTGDVGPIQQRVSHVTKLDPHLPRLQQLVEEKPDATLREFVDRLKAENVQTNTTAVHRALQRLKISFKKKVLRAAEQQRPDIQEKRVAWAAQRLGIDIRRLVFLDETAARTDMTRRYGRARRGKRVIGLAPQSHWKTTTFISALTVEGLTAPLAIDGSMNGTRFLDYIEHVLCPTLHPRSVVVMDNLKCHKNAGVRAALEAVGAEVLYLPPYSPDFNPIELAYSKLKRLLRTAEERTIHGLQQILSNIPQRFTPTECQAYMKHCGYSTAA